MKKLLQIDYKQLKSKLLKMPRTNLCYKELIRVCTSYIPVSDRAGKNTTNFYLKWTNLEMNSLQIKPVTNKNSINSSKVFKRLNLHWSLCNWFSMYKTLIFSSITVE